MNTAHVCLFAAASLFAVGAAADPHKDESGHGKRHGRFEHKQEYWDGNCKVEIKQKKGEYEEKRKCKGGQAHYGAPQPIYQAVPVYGPAPVYLPAPVYVEPGVTINGTVRVR